MCGLWLACAVAVLGHNPETSYAEVKIAADKVETRLTYDIFTLVKVVALDDDRDGRLSRAELTVHLPQIDRFLHEHIGLAVGTEDQPEDETEDLGTLTGFVWPPEVGDAIGEADFHSANGLIHFDFLRKVDQVPADVTLTFRFFREFGDRHTVLGNFKYGGRDEEITFDSYEPNYIYDTFYEPPLSHRLWRFFKLGVEHIFLGYDHICFLVALIVVSKFREIVKIVTSFTIAHSITLILATLDVVHVPTRLVETCIAATIVYVAVENLWVKDTRHRWWLTFFFGLVHGFGFANVLREMGLPKVGLVRCLLSFNLGVEVGQLAIALALLPLALLLARWKYGHIVVVAISITLALFGLAWFIDRAFALQFMPF